MNILILGGTGRIGKNLYTKLSQIKEYNLFTLSRSKNNFNTSKHYDFDFYENDLSSLEVTYKFEIIINCLGKDIFKNEILTTNIYKKFLNLLNSNFNSSWIEISSISTFGVFNFDKKNPLISDYGKSKLRSEKLLKKLSNKYNKNCTIFKFGAVISTKYIDEFIFNKFNKFKIFIFFINFFRSKPYVRITFIEEIYGLINSIIIDNERKNKSIVAYKNINILDTFKMKNENLYIINLNFKLIYLILFYLNKIFFLKFSSVFNPNLNNNDKEILHITEF